MFKVYVKQMGCPEELDSTHETRESAEARVAELQSFKGIASVSIESTGAAALNHIFG